MPRRGTSILAGGDWLRGARRSSTPDDRFVARPRLALLKALLAAARCERRIATDTDGTRVSGVTALRSFQWTAISKLPTSVGRRPATRRDARGESAHAAASSGLLENARSARPTETDDSGFVSGLGRSHYKPYSLRGPRSPSPSGVKCWSMRDGYQRVTKHRYVVHGAHSAVRTKSSLPGGQGANINAIDYRGRTRSIAESVSKFSHLSWPATAACCARCGADGLRSLPRAVRDGAPRAGKRRAAVGPSTVAGDKPPPPPGLAAAALVPPRRWGARRASATPARPAPPTPRQSIARCSIALR